MVSSIWCGLRPRPTESDPCGSKSTSRTLRPYSASAAPRLIVVVVLPTPPFWLHIAITRALPCRVRGRGSGRSGIGRPVGPRSTPPACGGTTGLLGLAARDRNSTGSAGVLGGAGGRISGGISEALLPEPAPGLNPSPPLMLFSHRPTLVGVLVDLSATARARLYASLRSRHKARSGSLTPSSGIWGNDVGSASPWMHN